MVIRHFGAEIVLPETVVWTTRIDIMEHVRIRCDMFLQQDMSMHLIVDAAGPATGRTAFMQGADEADMPAHRTLTSASAQVGITA